MAMTGGTTRLVKTGYADYGDTSLPIRLYVYYKTTQDVATNKSTIYVGMYVTTPSSSYAIGKWDDFNGSYVGTTSLTFNGTVPANTKGTYWLVENKTFTVNHKDDGTGKATIYWKWGVNSPWGQMVNPSGSFEITLPTIARASQPSVSASAVTMGNSVTIYTNRKSTSFLHYIRITFGSYTKNFSEVGDSVKWTVDDLASYIPNATSGTATITCTTYAGANHDVKVGAKSCTITVNVPAATTPTLPTSTASNPKYTGDKITIGLPSKSTNFAHQLYYHFLNESGYVSLDSSSQWTIPYSLCSQIPSEWSGTVTITCITYNGNAKVGEKTANLYFKVRDDKETKPKISSISLAPITSLASPFNSLYMQGYSKVKATYATSAPYSSVKSVTMTAQSKSVTGSNTTATSGILNNGGTNVAVTFEVTNARGQTNTGSATISKVHEYGEPLVSPLTGQTKTLCYRSDSVGKANTGGLYLTIKAQRSFYDVGGNNTCKLWYRLKTYDGLPFADNVKKETLLDYTAAGEYDSVVDRDNLSSSSSYTVEVGVTDTIGNSSSIVYFIPTAMATFHLAKGGKGASFGGYSDGDGLLVPWKARFTGAVQGNAYGLGQVPRILDGADINTYVVPGVYAIIQHDNAKTMTNLPIQLAGRLIVCSADGSGRINGEWAYILQEYISSDGIYRYTRRLHTEETEEWLFDPWRKILTEEV